MSPHWEFLNTKQKKIDISMDTSPSWHTEAADTISRNLAAHRNIVNMNHKGQAYLVGSTSDFAVYRWWYQHQCKAYLVRCRGYSSGKIESLAGSEWITGACRWGYEHLMVGLWLRVSRSWQACRTWTAMGRTKVISRPVMRGEIT